MTNKIKFNNIAEMLTNEDLDKVAGGTPGLVVPCIPGIPYVTVPGDYGKDKPKDGGATGSW